MSAAPARLYRHPLSGHSHRAQLMLSLLGRETELIEVDLLSGAHKAPGFLALNPLGQVPVLEDDDAVLPDSNAILMYLARKYDPTDRWLPTDALDLSRTQRWLSISAGPLVAGPAAARLAAVFGVPVDMAKATATAALLFTHLEKELAARSFLVSEHPTIADIAFYSYTAHAPEGGVSLYPYGSIRAWIARVEALPGFVPMARATGAAS
jgi:glutathione S-transferase